MIGESFVGAVGETANLDVLAAVALGRLAGSGIQIHNVAAAVFDRVLAVRNRSEGSRTAGIRAYGRVAGRDTIKDVTISSTVASKAEICVLQRGADANFGDAVIIPVSQLNRALLLIDYNCGKHVDIQSYYEIYIPERRDFC